MRLQTSPSCNWKLGRDKTKLCSHHISRLDKTVSKFSVADSLDLSPILFTPSTRTRQDKTILSRPCRWCGDVEGCCFTTMHLITCHTTDKTRQSCPCQCRELGIKHWKNLTFEYPTQINLTNKINKIYLTEDWQIKLSQHTTYTASCNDCKIALNIRLHTALETKGDYTHHWHKQMKSLLHLQLTTADATLIMKYYAMINNTITLYFQHSIIHFPL